MNDGGNTLLMLNESDLEKVFERLFTTYFEKMTTMMDDSGKHDETLLTEAEVAKMLNVTHATLWRWNNNGYLRNVKIGRRCLWRKSDIDKLMNQ